MPVSDPRGAEDWRPAAAPVEKHSLDEIARRLAELDRAARAEAAAAAEIATASPAAGRGEKPVEDDPFARIEARLKALGEELDRRARLRQEAARRPVAPPPRIVIEEPEVEAVAAATEDVPADAVALASAEQLAEPAGVAAGLAAEADAPTAAIAEDAPATATAAAEEISPVHYEPAVPASATVSEAEQAPVAAPSPAISLKAALAEILGRQRRLDSEPPPASVRSVLPLRPRPPVEEAPAAPPTPEPVDAPLAAAQAASAEGPAAPIEAAPAVAAPAAVADEAQPAAASPPVTAPQPSALERQIALLSEQMQAMRPERTEAAVASLRSDVEQIRAALGGLPSGGDIEALSVSIGRIAARLEETPSTRRVEELGEVLEGFRERLGTLATGEEVAALATSVQAVGARLEEAGTLDRTTLAALQAEVAGLKKGVERVPRPELLEIFAARIEQLGELVQAGNQPIVETLARLERQSDALAVLAVDLPGSEEFAALSGRVDALAGRLDAAASREDLVRLEHETRALHALVGTGRPAELARFEAQIETLAERVDGIVEATGQAERVGNAQLARLEAAMSELAARLDRAGEPDAPPETVAALEAQLRRLARHLDQIDTGKAQLATLERAVHELMGQLGAQQDATATTAERVALETARQLLSGTAGAAEASVLALSDRFDEMRRTSAIAEEAAQARLEAVHETLDKIVQRMAMLEEEIGVRGGARGPAARPAQPAMAAPSRSPSATAAARAAARRALGEHVPDRAEVLLEPGSGMPHPRPASVEGGRSAVDFIAAARRAAQAAAAESRVEEENAMRQTPIERAREFLKIGRRPLVLGIAAVVLLVGTVQLSLVSKMLLAREKEKAASPSLSELSRPQPAAQAAPPRAPRDATLEPLSGAAPAGDPAAQAPPSGTLATQDASPLSGVPLAPDPEITATVPAARPAPPPAATEAPPAAAGRPSTSLPAEIGGARLRDRANAGDPAAQYEIGVRYAEGRGVSYDTARAARWFEQAAAQNLAPAQYRLGGMYERGNGVAKDLEAARRWYERAAQLGHVKSMHNLAVLHAEGGLGAPDYTTAAHWFQKAAERGLVDSEYNLGVLMVRGLGVKRDLAAAYKWFALAAEQGDADAAAKRDAVAAKLAPADLAAAKLAAQAFQPKPSDPAANEVAAPVEGWDAALPRNARSFPQLSGPASRG